MEISRRQFVIVGAGSLFARANKIHEPAPYGAVPSAPQLRWHDLETYAFLHFTVNTFTDKEWGYGDEDPNIFNPTMFDPDAIVRDLKAGGMKAVILTCKHHDGFCLWPTKTTEHCIRNSRWRDGKGDVVRDIAAAAKRAGLKFGVYVSPWDRSNAKYGTPDYLPLYREQITELLTNYGPIFEVWFDGANGGDGYYGGAREKRSISAGYYQWDKILAIIHRLQSEAVIFGEAGDIRWVGNESGIAGDPCWATFSPALEGLQDAHASAEGSRDVLMHGVRNGSMWKPAECDVSIRPGWFWHESQNAKVKTPDQLVDLYFESVGRGASFLLNVPPNRKGLIEDVDAKTLVQYRQNIQRMFAQDLAKSARLLPSNVRGGSAKFGASNLVDESRTTYWATDDAVTLPNVTLEFGALKQVSIIRLREAIQLGQRIGAFGIDAWQGGGWTQIATGTSIGACRIIRLPAPVATSKIRLRITDSPVCIALAELSVFSTVS
ncbi:alpha-L-fucosidase [Edaphobacter acidisoli]|uniref:alpha-L-fucosidase n=1 Tax=Edaphobacter acidisoli TaxID=2040573 RepID=A0A916RR16_9BACT|nr:alpha-L-fucosidase [Edaphobacter acidisoli]GGA63864.1 alpha-L-fucosidase [Edaphobacter acidisoli]